MVVQCCCCKQIRVEDRWLPSRDIRVSDDASHTYCPTCFERIMAEVRQRHGLLPIQPLASNF